MRKDKGKKIILPHKEVNVKVFLKALAACFILALALAGLYVLEPTITGLIIGAKQLSYSDEISLEVNESSEFVWNLGHPGKLKAIKLSGTIENEGSAKAYVENKGVRYLIFDSNKLNEKEILDKITGFAAAENKDKGKEPNHPPTWKSDTESFVINTTLSINLGDYFEDKDNDTLKYNASELKTDDLEILLENAILTIYNKNNLDGNRTLEIFAYDNEASKKKDIVLILIKSMMLNETPIENITNQTINITPIINETTENITTNKTITISVDYKVGTNYDVDDNGIETITGVIDMSVEASRFSWDADESNVCTRWETYSVENEESTFVCYGSPDCCSLANLAPTREDWNEAFHSYYGLYGATLNNIISAQVIYADYNLSLENPYSEIVYSGIGNLSAVYYTGLIAFNDVCEDTCELFDFNETGYKLIFEINNTKLTIDTIDYIIEGEAEPNNEPVFIKNISNITMAKNMEYTIDLSEHFHDADNDTLAYSYFDMENITIRFEDNLMRIIPDENFTGSSFTFITANDSFASSVSNIFGIDVNEPKETFEIRNAEDSKLAVFDPSGNLKIKGILIQNTTPTADENDFAVQNSSGGLNLVVMNPEGNLLIRGILNENQEVLVPTPNSLILQYKDNSTFAYANSTGSLFLRGALTENALFG